MKTQEMLQALRLLYPLENIEALTRQAARESWSHQAYLDRLLEGECQRREMTATERRTRKARFPVPKGLEGFDWNWPKKINRPLVQDLFRLAFIEQHANVIFVGDVGLGKTHLATALGHIAIRRRLTVGFHRADKLFTRLRAARLDNTLDAELRRLTSIDLLIVDDFALRALDATQTNDFYEIVVERHRRVPTIWVSNREPAEWLGLTTDALLAQSAIDRLTSGAHTLVVEGPSYRQRGRVNVDPRNEVRHAR